ncbi:AraC family transcriptional regulator [Cellulomonas marina]|nr:AraC family transcriptional regulator [Cellulomonas marina]
MDEATVHQADSTARRDGFNGQRMLVVPRPVVRRALARPVTRRLVVTDAGLFPHAARHGRSRPGGAAEHVLLVCAGGAGWVEAAGARRVVPRGGVVVLPAGAPHAYGAADDDPWTLWWLHVTGPDADELVAAAVGAAGDRPLTHLRDPAPVAGLVAQALDGLDEGTTAGAVRAAGAAWHALALVAATGHRGPGTDATTDPVERAVAHLRATTPRRTSVAALAALVALSPSQLTARFRRDLGVSPLRYQTDLRMARARELLDTTDLPVLAVARATGYEDALYFSRQFTRTHGQSPTAYRARPR